MHIPETYAVLFLQGGATGQFAAIPMNLMTGSGSAVFGVFREPALARAAFPLIAGRWRSTFLCHTQMESVKITDEEETFQ